MAIFVHAMRHPLNLKYLKSLINKITSANQTSDVSVIYLKMYMMVLKKGYYKPYNYCGPYTVYHRSVISDEMGKWGWLLTQISDWIRYLFTS